MPQLDISAFLPQIIWLVITFLILYGLMAKVALPRVGSVLEERQAKIDDNLDTAENLRAAAKADEEAYEQSLFEAREKARQTVLQAHQEATTVSSERHAELGERLLADVKEAEARIDVAKENAIKEISGVAQSVASDIMDRLVNITPSEDAVAQAVGAAMKEKS